MVENSLWRLANLLGACSLDFPSDIDTDSAFFNAICNAALGRTTFWNASEKTLETGSIVNEIKDYHTDDDQELLEVKAEADAPDWIEKEGE